MQKRFTTLCFLHYVLMILYQKRHFFSIQFIRRRIKKISVKCIILTTAPSTWCVIYLEHGGLYNRHPGNVKER